MAAPGIPYRFSNSNSNSVNCRSEKRRQKVMQDKEGSEEDAYPLGRHLHASARLYVQHLLWNIRLGYLLHPCISVPIAHKYGDKEDGGEVRIADVGTGNALWPLELSHHLPPKTRIHGFDISDQMFPASQHLPPNIELQTLDILSEDPLPEELVGVFDVVHVRAFVCVIKNGRPGVVLEKVWEMLKPGGYLQWDEIDIGAYRTIQSPDSSSSSSSNTTTTTASETYVRLFKEYLRISGFQHNWIPTFPTHLAAHAFTPLSSTHLPPSPCTQKLETDDHLMAMEDVWASLEALVEKGDLLIGARVAEKIDMKGLKEEVLREVQEERVGLRMEWYCFVGKKEMEREGRGKGVRSRL